MMFCAAIRRDSVSLLRFTFHGHIQVFLCNFVCHLKPPCICFLFPCFCYFSVWFYVVNAVTGCCDESFFALSNVALEFFY